MIIAVSGGKGGTGKSMVASSLAYAYAQEKRPTWLIDADVECPNSHLLLNIERESVKTLFQIIPQWDNEACIECGKCARVCKQQAIIFVSGKKPALAKDLCIGCKACFVACPVQAISETTKEIGTIYQGHHYAGQSHEDFSLQAIS